MNITSDPDKIQFCLDCMIMCVKKPENERQGWNTNAINCFSSMCCECRRNWNVFLEWPVPQTNFLKVSILKAQGLTSWGCYLKIANPYISLDLTAWFLVFLPRGQICSVPKASLLIRESYAMRQSLSKLGLVEKLALLGVSIAVLDFGHR